MQQTLPAATAVQQPVCCADLQMLTCGTMVTGAEAFFGATPGIVVDTFTMLVYVPVLLAVTLNCSCFRLPGPTDSFQMQVATWSLVGVQAAAAEGKQEHKHGDSGVTKAAGQLRYSCISLSSRLPAPIHPLNAAW